MNMQELLTEQDKFYIDLSDIDESYPVYAHITYAAMDDDKLPEIVIDVEVRLLTNCVLTDEQKTFYMGVALSRFSNIIRSLIEKIVGTPVTEEKINEFNSLTQEELKERMKNRS